MIRIITVDDEPPALERIRHVCRELPHVQVVAEASNCEDALRAIERLRPDILLLDIQMRDGSGFDIIERMSPDYVPGIVLVSAFDRYAVRAFEAGVADYVLKPVQFDRLREAIDRARNAFAAARSHQQVEELRSVVASLRANMHDENARKYETELWIRRNVTGMARVPVESIKWVCSEEDYVRIHTFAGSHLMRSSISSLAERVDPSMFIRIHRRTLVNRNAIKELRRRVGKIEVILRSGERLPAGRIYARQLRQIAATNQN
jgi:two-component system LytT family response regulator